MIVLRTLSTGEEAVLHFRSSRWPAGAADMCVGSSPVNAERTKMKGHRRGRGKVKFTHWWSIKASRVVAAGSGFLHGITGDAFQGLV
jgi:hypothetical protein